ncbi:hypothetical protein [Peribacillus alkalitolerans]|uniref:hypothetical protein n=1 Tax=Peribacillus alkalitolerans TaxID=1550385 RepID=UPI0013D81711|nr:hypothetical protein [Peribacillus alkalitolerans]
MKHEVIKDFFDKNTNEFYPVGSEYEAKNAKRAKELQANGFLKEDDQKQPNE